MRLKAVAEYWRELARLRGTDERLAVSMIRGLKRRALWWKHEKQEKQSGTGTKTRNSMQRYLWPGCMLQQTMKTIVYRRETNRGSCPCRCTGNSNELFSLFVLSLIITTSYATFRKACLYLFPILFILLFYFIIVKMKK